MPENRSRPFSITYARFASPSATVANCSINSTPMPDSAKDRIVGIRRWTTTGAKPERQLVDDHETGPRHERLGEHDHLLLAARQRPRPARQPLLELGKQLERTCASRPRVLRARGEYVATVRFSSTVSSGNNRRPSGTTATPAWRIRSGRRPTSSRPSRTTEPPSGRSTPPTASTRLDLPAPFGPSSAVTSPAGTSSVTPRTTGRPPRWTSCPRASTRRDRWRRRRSLASPTPR